MRLHNAVACLFACQFAVQSVNGQITVLHQSGTMSAESSTGLVVSHAPSSSPWFGTISSGNTGGNWFAQTSVFTGWSGQHLFVYPEAIVISGPTQPVVTQSRFSHAVRFQLVRTTCIAVTTTAIPNDAPPNMPLNDFSMRITELRTGRTIVDGTMSRRTIIFAPGEYLVESSNNLGNTRDMLSISEAGRMLGVALVVEECTTFCDSLDFNGDGLFPNVQDIDDFLSVFAGGVCSGQQPSNPPCNSDIDFNNDGMFPDTLDIDSLLRVFAGGACL